MHAGEIAALAGLGSLPSFVGGGKQQKTTKRAARKERARQCECPA